MTSLVRAPKFYKKPDGANLKIIIHYVLLGRTIKLFFKRFIPNATN